MKTYYVINATFSRVMGIFNQETAAKRFADQMAKIHHGNTISVCDVVYSSVEEMVK